MSIQCFTSSLYSSQLLTSDWLHAELREMRQFVKTLGLTGRLAQMLVERHGKYTEARLKQDPYSCLHGMPGVTFRYIILAKSCSAPHSHAQLERNHLSYSTSPQC